MPLNILLADDSMTAQNMAKKILSEAGYEVTTVSNGAAALKKIAENTPDLVILDIYMPGYTGLEVCERVKRAATTSSMPVLLSVGKLEPYREQDATAVRADGVIVKPFEASELVTIVTNVILRASGATIDAATRPLTPPVAIQASPAAESKPLPVMDPMDHAAEMADLKSQARDAGPEDAGSAVAYNPATVSNGDYPGTSQTPYVEPGKHEDSGSGPAVPATDKLLAMAVPATAATTGPANFAAVSSGAAEANSSMPFMIDELLKAKEKAPEEDSGQRFAGPVLDVSPSEPATEQIEIIDIPAPEPSAETQVSEEAIPLRHEAVSAEATLGTGNSPEELTAIAVEAFLREHAAASRAETATDFASDAHVQVGDTATAATPDDSNTMLAEPEPGANKMQAPPLEERAAFGIAGDDQSVFEVEDEPFFAATLTDAVATAPIVEECAAQFHAGKPLVPADIEPDAMIESTFESSPAKAPAVADVSIAQVQERHVQVPVAEQLEPEPVLPALTSAAEHDAEPGMTATSDDFMFSVPMMVEATAAMSLPELSDIAPRTASESAGSSAFDSPKHAAEVPRSAALDEAVIAEAVQRVMERLKPRIVAEIARELAKPRP